MSLLLTSWPLVTLVLVWFVVRKFEDPFRELIRRLKRVPIPGTDDAIEFEFARMRVEQNANEAPKAEPIVLDDDLNTRAEQGDPRSQFRLGFMYARGMGVEKNEAKAVEWYREAAGQDHVEAQFRLGFMYGNGMGVEKNETEAFSWHQKAAEHGHVIAQYWLGSLYGHGKGVPQDYQMAYMWCNLAASRATRMSEPLIVASRDKYAARLSSEQLAEAQRRAREWNDEHP